MLLTGGGSGRGTYDLDIILFTLTFWFIYTGGGGGGLANETFSRNFLHDTVHYADLFFYFIRNLFCMK